MYQVKEYKGGVPSLRCWALPFLLSCTARGVLWSRRVFRLFGTPPLSHVPMTGPSLAAAQKAGRKSRGGNRIGRLLLLAAAFEPAAICNAAAVCGRGWYCVSLPRGRAQKPLFCLNGRGWF